MARQTGLPRGEGYREETKAGGAFEELKNLEATRRLFLFLYLFLFLVQGFHVVGFFSAVSFFQKG